MPRELVTVQVGQCGNQIGWRFWDLALREHAAASPDGVFDEAMSAFFRNVDERYSVPRDVESFVDGSGASVSKVASLRARAVLVDMEEGVVSQVLSGPLRDLFDESQVITDVSGSGNNWCGRRALRCGGSQADAGRAARRRRALSCSTKASARSRARWRLPAHPQGARFLRVRTPIRGRHPGARADGPGGVRVTAVLLRAALDGWRHGIGPRDVHPWAAARRLPRALSVRVA